MIDVAFPPGSILILAGLALPIVTWRIRETLLLLAPLLTLAAVWSVPDGTVLAYEYLGMDIVPVKSDALTRLFATIFAFAAFAGALYALKQTKVHELAAAFVYAGSAINVTFAGDLVTVFIFWEIMAIGSTVVVWAGGPKARGPGLRYAVIHFVGGVLLMAGVAGHVAETGSTAFGAMQADSIAHWLILAAFLVNAGAPPLTAWLPDAYPSASWSGMVFLSAFTTKTAVYALMRGFPGEEPLIWFGLYMAGYGVIYAILENDMRRLLAYALVGKVGLMLVAIGVGTPLALNGAAALAFVHILYKSLLLMGAGAVMRSTGHTHCTELGGLWRSMPLTMLCVVVAALTSLSVPLTAGFAAKGMISSGVGEAGLMAVWLAVTAASAAVVLQTGLAFPWFVFFGRDRGLRPADPPWNMRAAMLLLVAACLALGLWGGPLYAMLPHDAGYKAYKPEKVVFQLQLVLFSSLAFFLLLGWLRRTRTITLDFDWFWRRLGRELAREFEAQWLRELATLARRGYQGFLGFLERVYQVHGPEGAMARTRPSGYMALWMTVLLALFLVLSFL